MQTPGSDRPIQIEPAGARWRADFNGHVIADTTDALILREGEGPPTVYFPREDVALEYMARTDYVTRSAHGGQAGHYTIRMNTHIEDNAAWSYEEPGEGYGALAGRIAFKPGIVEVYPVDDAAVNRHHTGHEFDRTDVDEVVQHTDSGSGRTQGEHWRPNVEQPGGREDRGGVN
jgi:uncharacterized protein (DUF427 family)